MYVHYLSINHLSSCQQNEQSVSSINKITQIKTIYNNNKIKSKKKILLGFLRIKRRRRRGERMSIDREVAEIRIALVKFHELLHKVTNQMENATGIVNNELSSFDISVNEVAREVSKIRDHTNTVADFFPSNATYIAALLVLDAIIWVLAFVLLYLIVVRYRERQVNTQRWQEKYKLLVRSFRRQPPPSRGRPVIITDDVETGTVYVHSEDLPYSYRPNKPIIRNPPSSYYKDEESESLLREIPPENRYQWTSIE